MRVGVQSVFQVALWLAYPFILYGGLYFGSPRWVGVGLLIVLALRQRRYLSEILADFNSVERLILAALLFHAGLVALTNSEMLVRLFPCVMNMGMGALFGLSLYRGPSLIERFARIKEPNLPPEAIPYTRRVTQVWCVFLGVNTLVSVWTALAQSREVWAFYNGFLVYVFMGVLFVGEWWCRQRMQRKIRASQS